MVDYIYNMKMKIFEYLMNLYNDPSLLTEYNVVNDLYTTITTFQTEEEIRDYFLKLREECLHHHEYTEYKNLLEQLKTEKDKTKREEIHDRLAILVRRLNGRHKVLHFLSDYLVEMNKVNGVTKTPEVKESQKEQPKPEKTKVEEPKKKEKKSESKPSKIKPQEKPAEVKQKEEKQPLPQTNKEQKQPLPQDSKEKVSKVENKAKPEKQRIRVSNELYSQLPDDLKPMAIYIEFSNSIIAMLGKYNSLDKNTSEAKKLRMQINSLLDSRQDGLLKAYGEVTIVNLSKIESLEERIARAPLKLEPDHSLKDNEYLEMLKDTIIKINDLEFNGINSKYFTKDSSQTDGVNENKLFKQKELLIKRYHNLVKSLFREDKLHIPELDGFDFDDLIPMLSTCSMNCGYKEFKEKFKSKKIGSDEITKEIYEKRQRELKLVVDTILRKSVEKLSGQNNKVIVFDFGKTRKDLLTELHGEYKSMYMNILNSSQTRNRNVGETSVHR